MRCPLFRREKNGQAHDKTLVAGVTKLKRRYCIFNKTRESFLSLNITAADTHFARLKGLVGRIKLKGDEGIWVVPS